MGAEPPVSGQSWGCERKSSRILATECYPGINKQFGAAMSEMEELDKKLFEESLKVRNETGVGARKDDLVGGFFSCSVVVFLFIVMPIYIFWIAPKWEKYSPAPNPDAPFIVALVKELPNASWSNRVVVMHADCLDIYIPKGDFEAIPYPDREAALARVGKVYGQGTTWYWFSSIRFRDIQTGAVLADYSCNFDSVSLTKLHWWD